MIAREPKKLEQLSTDESEVTDETVIKIEASFIEDVSRMNYARQVSTSEALRKKVLAFGNGHSIR